MENSTILSIIIPVYNVEDYIRECLDSLIKQDLTDCEIICVDDGSTDNSLKILQEYQLGHTQTIKVFSQPNQGQASARNLAIDNALGEYIAFLDSDDYYLPHALTTIKGIVQTYSMVDVFYLDSTITSEGKRFYTIPFNKSIIQSTIDYYDWQYKEYGTTPEGCVCGWIYKKSFLDENRLRMQSGVYYEDELFVFSIFANKGSIMSLHLSIPYYYYRVGRIGSTVTSLREKNFKDRMVVAREMNKIMHLSGHITEARKHKIFGFYLNNIIEAYLHGFIGLVTKLYTKEDIIVMTEGSVSIHERRLIFLLKLSPRLMAAYKTNQLPSLIRRCINRFIK